MYWGRSQYRFLFLKAYGNSLKASEITLKRKILSVEEFLDFQQAVSKLTKYLLKIQEGGIP